MSLNEKMVYEDLPIAAAMSIVGIAGIFGTNPVAGTFVFVVGAVWLGLRIFHLVASKHGRL